MTEIQRVGLILLIAGIVIIAAFIAEKRERERRKAANREQLREMRRHRRSFIRDMRGIELFEMVLSLLFIIGASVASSLITLGLMCCVGVGGM